MAGPFLGVAQYNFWGGGCTIDALEHAATIVMEGFLQNPVASSMGLTRAAAALPRQLPYGAVGAHYPNEQSIPSIVLAWRPLPLKVNKNLLLAGLSPLARTPPTLARGPPMYAPNARVNSRAGFHPCMAIMTDRGHTCHQRATSSQGCKTQVSPTFC
jgi:hypothetical protein